MILIIMRIGMGIGMDGNTGMVMVMSGKKSVGHRPVMIGILILFD